jgi:crotonobetainyl-CoA:carnitine CoA-transferase CaiB-like acyl-CoA transferase
MTRTICEGLQVLEMGAGSIGASLAGMLFADNGARVLKVEPPDGDRLRQQHPAGFLVWNRGKESIVADLRTDEGRARVRELAGRADVVIEGFGAGVANGWGLGDEHLRAVNPGLVYCSVTGFGSRGPYAKIPAYEGIVAAKAGVYNLGPFGFRSGPIFVNAPLGSVGAGHMAFSGVLAALIAREETGRGQQVEATLLQGFNPLDYFGTMTWQHTQRTTGSAHGTSAVGALMGASRYSFFVPTQDGRWVIFTQMLPHQAQALSRAVGMEQTFDDPRFDKQPQFATAEDAQAWEDLLWEAMAAQPYEHWEKVFLADPNIAFELARFSEEGLDHQQIRHNGEAVTVSDAARGPIEQIGPLACFATTPSRIDRSAPVLDDHAGDFDQRQARKPSGGAAPSHALDGVTIVELGYFYAMPYGVTMAGALGARVIKLEGATGDPMRSAFGAAEVGGAKTMEGKESLAVDLQTPEGQKIVQEAAAKADMFVNGFRSGVAERMGLDYNTLSQLNPHLVYVHAAGYGIDGPFAHRPIYAQVAQAVAGSIGRYGGRWLDPEFTKSLSWIEAQIVVLPRLRGIVDGDSNAALGVLSSILLALYEQRRTGEGQFLSTTMIGGNALAYADDFLRYDSKPALTTADEENHGLHALYRLYRAGAGWIFLAAPRQREWEALTTALDRTDLARDGRFSTQGARLTHDDALVAVLAEVFATRDAGAWEHLLTAAGVACVEASEVGHSEFTCTDPVLRETGLVVEVDHPLFEKVLRAGPPVALSDTPGRAAAGCLLGQHTHQILEELGYTAEQVEELETKQVVFGRHDQSA